jgi:hypothetical protein
MRNMKTSYDAEHLCLLVSSSHQTEQEVISVSCGNSECGSQQPWKKESVGCILKLVGSSSHSNPAATTKPHNIVSEGFSASTIHPLKWCTVGNIQASLSNWLFYTQINLTQDIYHRLSTSNSMIQNPWQTRNYTARQVNRPHTYPKVHYSVYTSPQTAHYLELEESIPRPHTIFS